MALADLSREAMLALTPDVYLRDGFRGPDGKLRPELLTQSAFAAALQLLQAQLAPQEFSMTVAALRQVLPLHQGAPQKRISDVLDETFAVVGRMIRQPNNEGLVTWCRACAAAVSAPADIDFFCVHVEAVLRQYVALASLPPPPSSPPLSAGQARP